MRTGTVHLQQEFWTEYRSMDHPIRSWIRGHVQRGGIALDFSTLAALPTSAEVAEWTGSFAVIVAEGSRMVLITDQVRSIAIFYSERGARVGDDHSRILDGGKTPDPVAARWLPHAGFVVGSRTLFAGLRQVQAGEIVVIDAEQPSEPPTRTRYRQFGYSANPITDPAEANQRFAAAFTASFDRLLARADGRQLVVPLSGGLDSRLISAHLRLVDYPNVVNFTYGRPGSAEVGVSKRVAALLGQPWHFVPYEPTLMADAWAASEAGRFIEYGHSASAVPHVQDWYALAELKRKRVLDDDAIILPGHTVVGNIHDGEILDEVGPVSRTRMKEVLTGYHYALLGRSDIARDDPEVNAWLDCFLTEIGYDGTPITRAAAIEFLNVTERQAKYINNSMRAYEFFGYEWALPMLDTEMDHMWHTLDIRLTRDRDWYQSYVDELFSRASGTSISYFAPMSASESTRSVIKSVLRGLHLESAAQRVLTARAVAHHHMSFNRLIGPMSQRELVWRTLRGQNLVGIFAELFLLDQWNAHTHVFH